ncbi:DUF3152 domain-containing protein [Streptomyces sp. NRRL S-340]|uniref:DUF3152 domain-containing protein n=1 Tax=Streptomyces sp. NRRL S-340 TaxID=1463901 RepID=UPI00055D7AA3
MGRHSRRGPAPKGDSARTTETTDPAGTAGTTGDAPGAAQTSDAWGAARADAGRERRGAPPAQGAAPAPSGYGSGPHFPGGTPAHGVPRLPDGTPARGVPRLPDGTPAHGVPQARGGHPEQRESGGGWGEFRARSATAGGAGRGRPAVAGPGRPPGHDGPPGHDAPARPASTQGAPAPGGTGPTGPTVPIPRQRQAPPAGGPRQDYLDAFDEGADAFVPRSRRVARPSTAPSAPATAPAGPAGRAGRSGAGAAEGDRDGAAPPPGPGAPAGGRSAKGRTFTGIAAAAVTTVLAVIVAGQVGDDRSGTGTRTQAATGEDSGARSVAGPGGPAGPSPSPGVKTLTYEQKMNLKYALSPTLKGPGRFDVVPGSAKAPGRGRKYTYRVDVEQGLGLDARLFADAVQKTLNDDRSWAHDGARTFERVSSGASDFVITLASPGTTAAWCAKSGLDTTEDNVSCDSAATPRVMINAYRWAQGAKTFGDRMYAYRQMLINHEVGHRLGHNHVSCQKDGEPAPVMQQQTKFLDHDGIHCLPNSWPYPKS